MKIKKVVVAGGGVLGSQIAFQSAYCGYDVTVWARSDSSAERVKGKIVGLKETYTNEINAMSKNKADWCIGIADVEKFDKKECLEKVKKAADSVKVETDLKAALKGADLIIEAISELKKDKIAFYKMIAPILDDKTIVATNSSTLLPSSFAKYTGRPKKYLAIHFANAIWKNNTAEIMAHEDTNGRYFDDVVDFAAGIRMLPLPIKKEKSGYLLNSMLVPFLFSGLDLYVAGVSDPKSIDLAWKAGTGAPKGPFEIMDIVGMQTVYNIIEQYQKVPSLINPLLKKMMMPYNFKTMKKVIGKYIDEGKLGKSAGEGFYKY